MSRKPYPTDVSNADSAFVAPSLTLMSEEAPQREYSLREVFNGLRWMARAGGAWRLMPHDASRLNAKLIPRMVLGKPPRLQRSELRWFTLPTNLCLCNGG